MIIDHDFVVGFSKSFGLFYLIALSIGVARLRVLAVEQEAVRRGRAVDPRDEDKPHRIKPWR